MLPAYKTLLLKLSTVLITTLISLLLLEGLLRVAWNHPYFDNITLYEKHPFYKHRPIPGIDGTISFPEFSYQTTHSMQGLRGAASFDSLKSQQRILLLGDSFLYGVGVNTEESFASLLSQHFADLAIANTGAAAYDTRSELAVLDAFGRAFQPDIVLLFLFWNDLEGNLLNDFPDYGFDAQGNCLRTDSMRMKAFDPLAIEKGAGTIAANRDGSRLKFLFYEAIKGLRYRWWGIRKRPIETEDQKEQALQKTFDLLRVAQCLSDLQATQLVIVGIPDHNQVNPEASIKHITSLNFDIQEPLARFCQDEGLEYLDLLPQMREDFQTSGDDYYYFYDRHLNVAGHERVAAYLIDYLERRRE